MLYTKMLQVVPKTEHTEMLQCHSRLKTVLKTVAMVHDYHFSMKFVAETRLCFFYTRKIVPILATPIEVQMLENWI